MLLDWSFVGLGLIAVAVALYGTVFYYGGEFGTSNKRAPTRSGKVLFFAVGSIFITLGLLDLFGVIVMSRK